MTEHVDAIIVDGLGYREDEYNIVASTAATSGSDYEFRLADDHQAKETMNVYDESITLRVQSP